jgi:hypothetical protein
VRNFSVAIIVVALATMASAGARTSQPASAAPEPVIEIDDAQRFYALYDEMQATPPRMRSSIVTSKADPTDCAPSPACAT